MKVKAITGNGNNYATRMYPSVKAAYKTEMSILRFGINALGEEDAYVGIFWDNENGTHGKCELFSSNGNIGGYTKESRFNEFYNGTPRLLWVVPVREVK